MTISPKPTHQCNHMHILQADCVGTFEDPLTGTLQPRVWSNMWLNFDNVRRVLACLYGRMDGWMGGKRGRCCFCRIFWLAARAASGVNWPIIASRPASTCELQVGNALLTLFITATLDGYTQTMYMSMATRSDGPPRRVMDEG